MHIRCEISFFYIRYKKLDICHIDLGLAVQYVVLPRHSRSFSTGWSSFDCLGATHRARGARHFIENTERVF